jgi:glycosyltransferase involved in cell wall biosynthesis
MRLDILVPVYEPHEKWAEELINQYNQLITRLPGQLECSLIIVNDGSKRALEGDAEKIMDAIEESTWHSYSENRGKGYALREAAKLSDGDYIMYTDYDFPYTYGSMELMIQELLKSEVDAVVGKRDDSYYGHISPRRKYISKILKNVNKALFHLPTEDTQCGLKAFSKKLKPLFLQTTTDRYLIDVEFLKILARQNVNVAVQTVKLRRGVVLSKIGNLRLMKEMYSYFRIMLG